jgi:hypothetical protein
MTQTLVIGNPIWSGHCQFPETAHPERSHERCVLMGAGSTANPRGIFHPCPDVCHLGDEEYECECGGIIREAPALGLDEDGDPIYVHISEDGKRALFDGCP